MQVWSVLHRAGCKCRTQKSKNCHLGTIAQLCRAISSQLRHVSTIGKILLSSNIFSTCSHNMVNFGLLVCTHPTWNRFIKHQVNRRWSAVYCLVACSSLWLAGCHQLTVSHMSVTVSFVCDWPANSFSEIWNHVCLSVLTSDSALVYRCCV